MKKSLINFPTVLIIICIPFEYIAASSSNPPSFETPGISTLFVTASPILTTFFSSDYTDDKKRKKEYRRRQALKMAEDDAITYIATNGQQGKTVKFEAAAKELRKEARYKNFTDLEIAQVILKLK